MYKVFGRHKLPDLADIGAWTLYMDEGQQLKPQATGDPIGLKPGEIFWNNYRVINIVGRGGVSTVYKAENVNTKEIVAIKVLHTQKVHDEELVRRFVREAQNTMQLEEPHVVRIIEWGIDKLERPFMIMEFLSGETLSKRIERSRGLSFHKSVDIMEQVCSAIAEAHSKGIIHRDLKPENIMLTTAAGREDFVKVFDFGIAKKEPKDESDEGQVALTKSGAILGTPQYMSPEQLRGKKADARSDIYALGIIMYEMITGRPPFYSKNTAEIVVGHLNVVPDSPSRVRIDMGIPDQLSDAVLRALSKNPWERPTTVQEFRQSLQRAIERSAPRPNPVIQETPMPQAISRQSIAQSPVMPAQMAGDPVRRVCPNCKTLNTGANFRYCLKCGQDNMNRWLPYKEKKVGKDPTDLVSSFLNIRILILILLLLVVFQGYQFIIKPVDLSGNYKATFDHQLFANNKDFSETLAKRLCFDKAEVVLSQDEDQLEGVISTKYGQGALKGTVTVVDPLIVAYEATCSIRRPEGRLDLEIKGSFNKLLRSELWRLSANFFGKQKTAVDTVRMELE